MFDITCPSWLMTSSLKWREALRNVRRSQFQIAGTLQYMGDDKCVCVCIAV
jgi:hypothetical protein